MTLWGKIGESVASIEAVTDFVFRVPVLLPGVPPGCSNIFIKVYSVVVSDMLIIRFCSNLQNSFQLVQLALKLSVVLLQNHLKNNSAFRFDVCPRKT